MNPLPWRTSSRRSSKWSVSTSSDLPKIRKFWEEYEAEFFKGDDPKAVRMFQAMAERKLPLLVHTGDTRYPYSDPERMARALDKVPSLKAICAHLGGWSVWDQAWKLLAGRGNVWVDCSSSLYAMDPQVAVKVIHRYGADRVFFGTDYPMWKPDEELKRFHRLSLTSEEEEMILHKNFERFAQEHLGLAL